ncbi:MAG: hypothetical protein O3B68_21915, partial [Planctomycetota bacterium]|nr:hypothetical protein [Planctomycetota bacterium]
VRFVDGSVSIPSTMILPAGASTASLGGFALAGLARAATDNEADRVYNNSVDDARKVLADDRAQAAVDEALADFDQAIIDRDAAASESEPIELPELLKYQKRDDEPEVPTYELYEEGTIWGDRDWHEQGFNPAPDPGPGFIFRNRIDHRRRCGDLTPQKWLGNPHAAAICAASRLQSGGKSSRAETATHHGCTLVRSIRKPRSRIHSAARTGQRVTASAVGRRP